MEDIVEVLKKNNAKDIFVVNVPTNVRYVDYIVIASGKSEKHLLSISEFVHKLFKKKRRPTDSIPRFVNKKPLDWIAVDLGKSHIFVDDKTIINLYFNFNNIARASRCVCITVYENLYLCTNIRNQTFLIIIKFVLLRCLGYFCRIRNKLLYLSHL